MMMTATSAPSRSPSRQLALEKDARAREIERQLASLLLEKDSNKKKGGGGSRGAGNSDNHGSNLASSSSLRTQLCELLADLVLTDPLVASQRRAIDRLWRQCFYVRISKFRSKLQQQQQQQQKQQRSSAKAASTTSSSTGAAAAAAAATTIERHLAEFLGEAVTLYQYLIDKLQEKLLLAESTTAAPAATTATASNRSNNDDEQDGKRRRRKEVTDGADESESAASSAAVAEGLHKLYVCLGDLHRYSSNPKAAQASYVVSARLGPGMGHPANQLGVLCGSRILSSSSSASSTSLSSSSSNSSTTNQSATGLYWYARALLASHEPFETAAINLSRLFQANRQWLDDHDTAVGQQQQQPPARSNKNAQASLFLAKFVRMHGHIVSEVDDTNNNAAYNSAKDGGDATAAKTTTAKASTSTTSLFFTLLEEVTSELAALLRQSALSDTLLAKLVVIQAFSENYPRTKPPSIPAPLSLVVTGGGRGTTAPPMASSSSLPLKTERHQCARIATLVLGIQVSHRVVALLEPKAAAAAAAVTLAAARARPKAASQKRSTGPPARAPSLPSVRLLLPLVLLTEYVRASIHEYPTEAGSETVAAAAAAAVPDGAVGGSGSFLPSSSSKSDVTALRRRIGELSHEFWHQIAAVLNLLRLLYPVEVEEDDHPEDIRKSLSYPSSFLPKEYLALRGFLPFGSFIPQGGGNGGFLAPREAAEVLVDEKLLAGSGGCTATTQDSLSSSAHGTSGAGRTASSGDAQHRRIGSSSASGSQQLPPHAALDSSRIKVARFLCVGRELAGDSSGLPGFGRAAGDDGRFVYDPVMARGSSQSPPASPSSPMELDFCDDDGGDNVNMRFEEADERPTVAVPALRPDGLSLTSAVDSSTVLVYKQDEAGGPALLVPTALLQQNPNSSIASIPAASAVAPGHPFAAPGLPVSAATTANDLRWLHDQNSVPAFGVAAPTPLDTKSSALDNSAAECRLATERNALSLYPRAEADLIQLAALTESATLALSRHDASPAPVLPPPGFGSISSADHRDPPVPSQFQDCPVLNQRTPASTSFSYLLGAPLRREANSHPSFTLLDTSHTLFGASGAIQTTNPFVVPQSSQYGLPCSGLDESYMPYSLSNPPLSGDVLWMMQDALGGEDYVGTSLLDSGLLHSMMDDDGSSPQKPATTKNPFAT